MSQFYCSEYELLTDWDEYAASRGGDDSSEFEYGDDYYEPDPEVVESFLHPSDHSSQIQVPEPVTEQNPRRSVSPASEFPWPVYLLDGTYRSKAGEPIKKSALHQRFVALGIKSFSLPGQGPCRFISQADYSNLNALDLYISEYGVMKGFPGLVSRESRPDMTLISVPVALVQQILGYVEQLSQTASVTAQPENPLEQVVEVVSPEHPHVQRSGKKKRKGSKGGKRKLKGRSKR